MATELLLAPPATGKTSACIERILAFRKDHLLGKIWVVVPDRLQAASFRRRLAARGGVLGCSVGTFGGFYQHILECAGACLPITSGPVQHRLIQDTVDTCANRGEIDLFAPLKEFPGFIQALRDAFAELKRSLVFPDRFLETVQTGTIAQRELAGLYFQYQSRLIELGWADPEGMSWLAVAALEEQPALASSIHLLVVDGFDAFTGAQYQALNILSRQAANLLITFPGQPGSQRTAHRRFSDTTETLTRKLAPKITTLGNTPWLSPNILFIEKYLYEGEIPKPAKPERPFLLEARSPAEEAREALRWIKGLVVRQGVALSECAIFTPNPDLYQPLLKGAAREFGIPVSITQGEPLSHSPAVAALMNLLSLPLQNFKTRLLINVLRSPYFETGIPPDSVELLDEISRVSKVVEGQDQWREAWQSLGAAEIGDQPDLGEDQPMPGLPAGIPTNKLRRSLEKIFGLFPVENQLRSHTAWVTWLEDLLEELQFYLKADNPQDQTACEVFRESLRSLVLSETVAGERNVDYVRFYADLQGTLEGAGIPETNRWNQTALLIAHLLEARGLRFRAVALLGLSEGIFPAVEKPDPFLDEELRAELGLEPRLKREQAGLFYQAVTRSDQFLLITRPYLSDDGEKWEESPYWKAVKRLFDPSAVQRIRPDDPRPLAESASSQELLFSAVRRGSLPEKYAGLVERWEGLRHARDVLHARRTRRPGGSHEGYTDAIAPLLGERFPTSQVWSSSRLETYGNCPFWFFVQTALKLEPRVKPEVGFDAAQLGSILHKILEETYQNAGDPGDLAVVQEALHAAAGRIFATAPADYGFRPSPLWEIEKGQLMERLGKTIEALAEESEGWTPVAYEAKFGIDRCPLLNIDLGEEMLRIRGVIDRVDRNREGNSRVIDYKTGGSHFSEKDLDRGYRLQLPIYALAARDALGLGEPVEGFYWLINSAKSSSLKLGNYGVREAFEKTIEHLVRITSGVRRGEFPPQPPRDGCPSYCPATGWCWRLQTGW